LEFALFIWAQNNIHDEVGTIENRRLRTTKHMKYHRLIFVSFVSYVLLVVFHLNAAAQKKSDFRGFWQTRPTVEYNDEAKIFVGVTVPIVNQGRYSVSKTPDWNEKFSHISSHS